MVVRTDSLLTRAIKVKYSDQVSVVDIKKKRSTSLVVRAGARYLYTRGDLNLYPICLLMFLKIMYIQKELTR